jgi:hypothetical protein
MTPCDKKRMTLRLILSFLAAIVVAPHLSAQPALRYWGTGAYGSTNVPANLPIITAVSAGYAHTLALTSDGTVIAWGEQDPNNLHYGQTAVPAGLSNVVSIAAGYANSLALQSNGTMTCWGLNPLTLTGVKAIAAGIHNVVLKNDGTVYCWGVNSYGECNVPAGLQNVAAIGAGPNHTLAVKSNGTIIAWGKNNFGQTNIPFGLSNVVAVGGGDFHSVALKGDGKIIIWGDNRYNQTNMPANLSNVVAIACGWYHTIALKTDKTITTWGYNNNQQINAPAGLSNVVSAAAGAFDSFALAPYPPQITNQTAPPNATLGGQLAFGITATGTPPLLFQWWFNHTNIISGATNSSLLLTNVTLDQAGIYTVIVSNDYGSVTSSIAATVNKLSQSIVFDAIPAKLVTDAPFNLSAHATSGLPVNFASSDTNVATVNGNLVTIAGAGSATITASQSGDANYAPAVADRTLTVSRLSQSITFNPLPTQLITNPPFALTGTADSGLPVSYSSSNPSVATVSSNVVSIVGLGSTIITASQDGDPIYSPAPSVDRLLTVNGFPPSITTQPNNTVITPLGQTIALNVVATGTPLLSYQWLKNQSQIFAATNSTFTMTNVQVSDMASYQVIITNNYGCVTSSTANLFVIHPAVISPVVSFGFVVDATITDGGYGYTTPPVVRIIGGGGSGAVATATVSNGVVTGITILNAGSGYTNAPIVAIAPPFPLTLGIAPATGLTFTNLRVGTNYQLQISQSATWVNLGSSFVADAGSYTQYFDGTVSGFLYRLMALPIPYGATATPIVTNGFVVSATVNDGGSGYVSVPAVQIIGGGGSGAHGTATVSSGAVTAINMNNAGFGYTSLPTIQIDPPPVPALLPNAEKAFRLDYNGLTPLLTYQLQASPGLSGWTNFGTNFTATDYTNSQYFISATNGLFFRLFLLP